MKGIPFIAVALAMLAVFSCNKNSNSNVHPHITAHEFQANALVQNTGAVAADGCGWLLSISGQYYKPDSLSTSFQKDSLKVLVDYITMGTSFQCGLNPDNKIPVIHIKTIQTN